MLFDINYALVGETAVAYTVIGDGPVDLLIAPPVNSHLDIQSELPEWVEFHQRLGQFARVFVFDKRGTGLSDPLPGTGVSTLEERVDDMLAIMEHAGSERVAVMGYGEGGAAAALFAATHPDRTSHLILLNTTACLRRRDDYPWGWDPVDTPMANWLANFGKEEPLLKARLGSALSDPRIRMWATRWVRSSSSPLLYRALQKVAMDIDVRKVLPAISAPTLVMHCTDNHILDPQNGRFLAAHIAGARFVELPGDEHYPFLGDNAALIAEIEEHLTGSRTVEEAERVLATVLFTDIVDSTQTAARMGDREWKTLLTRHHEAVRDEIARHRGREIATAGDGFLATFDGPARAVRCAWNVHKAVEPYGIRLRAGLHTGEIELHGDTIAGIGVHIAARVASIAGAGEVLVSRTVRDLVAGSGISFVDRGRHTLKGVPDEWEIYAAQH
ncbi:MAG TPA: adenylate/guanylate cyclase domain-containing protein [Actinomycetota bacterium]|nr:adenylate/guanylate cyclase domain-containing protein [Actinomycetota bacterium]